MMVMKNWQSVGWGEVRTPEFQNDNHMLLGFASSPPTYILYRLELSTYPNFEFTK